MENLRRLVTLSSAALALATIFWPTGAEARDRSGTAWSVTSRSLSGSASPQGHLYVLDLASNKAVYRFPLGKDGLPSTQPDGVMYPQGAVYPQGLAVDTVGHIFVADPNGWGGAIAEFAAGAMGEQQPISTLFESGPNRLNIDSTGRLYVHLNASQDIAIFAQGAQGHDAPISVVPPYNSGFVVDYVVANSGALYVLNYVRPVAVFDHPLENPSQPSELIWPDDCCYPFNTTLAMDEQTDRLYVQFYVTNNPKYWNKVNYDVRPPSVTDVGAHQFIFTGDCGSTQASYVGGTVIVKKYLIVSCNSNGTVLVYRTDQFGRQRAPVETVGLGKLCCPWQIAVGP